MILSEEFDTIRCGTQVMAKNILTNRRAQMNWTRPLGYLNK
jgi:hypothetical protein